jgi:hypothetical protein
MSLTQGLDTQALAQFEGRQHRTPGMILLPHRGTKHGHKTLPSDIRDGTVVAMHHLMGQRKKRLHQAVHDLWSAMHGQRGGVRHSTAEDCHQLVSLVQG